MELQRSLLNEADITDVCFPDENYNYEEMKERSVFIGAYDSGKAWGLQFCRMLGSSICTYMI